MNPLLEVGERFGSLVIIGAPASRNGRYYPCKCECGNPDLIWVTVTNLRKRVGTERGCERCYRIRHGHGSSSDPTYSKWQAMKARCYDPKHKSYPDYGAAGVTVCDQWRYSFANFLADLGPCPGPGMTLERKDLHAGYEPGNVRWATKQEQAENTTANIVVEIDGVRYPTLRRAAEAFGLPYTTVLARVTSYKWDIERALRTPRDTRKIRKDYRQPTSAVSPGH